MSTRDNAEPRDGWQVEPRVSPFDALMERAECDLPAATWSKPGDLGRMSIDAMSRAADIPPNVTLGDN